MTGGSTGFLKTSEGGTTILTSKLVRFQKVNSTSTVTQNNDYTLSPSVNKNELKIAQQPYPSNSMSQKRATPWTPSWYAQCLRDQSPLQAMVLLHLLVHTQHQPEATPEVLSQLNQLTVEKASDAIHEMQGPQQFIRGSGNSLTIGMELTTLDDQHQFFLRGLVDSGCTGSSIDSGFVKAKGLNAQPLPHPIPVYNADGTLNNGGLITHTITL